MPHTPLNIFNRENERFLSKIWALTRDQKRREKQRLFFRLNDNKKNSTGDLPQAVAVNLEDLKPKHKARATKANRLGKLAFGLGRHLLMSS